MHTAAVHIGAAPAVPARSPTCGCFVSCRIRYKFIVRALKSDRFALCWISPYDDNLHMAACAHNLVCRLAALSSFTACQSTAHLAGGASSSQHHRATISHRVLTQCASNTARKLRAHQIAQGAALQHTVGSTHVSLRTVAALPPRAAGNSGRSRRQHGSGVRCSGAAADASASHLRLSERQDGAQGAQRQAETEAGRLRRAGGPPQRAGHRTQVRLSMEQPPPDKCRNMSASFT